jgi:hypothetical protein
MLISLSLCTRHPTTCTLHPTPYTLHPTPYTLHPTPYTPYAPQQRTSFYKSGHFDQPFWHADKKSQQRFLFDQTSFRLFRPCNASGVGFVGSGIGFVGESPALNATLMRRLHFVLRDANLQVEAGGLCAL